ncbi:MAG: TIM barrel protein, partial [Planctomycetota bacterium]|nr:TIM barrel protein [Planctomycetota bacterium]
MKIAVSSYSYSQCLGQGKDLFWVVEQAARMGFAGIEFVGLPGDEPLELARRLRAAAAKARLPIVSYTVGADLLNDPPAAVAGVRAQLDIAAALGAPVLRHDAAYAPPEKSREESAFDAALPALADKVDLQHGDLDGLVGAGLGQAFYQQAAGLLLEPERAAIRQEL